MSGSNRSLYSATWIKDKDDWLGVSDSQERRRIQNRRNQRTFRKKIDSTAQSGLIIQQERGGGGDLRMTSARGPFSEGPSPALASVSKLPTALQPTELQHITPHHPWIDLLPMPRMRDNIFCKDVESFDEEELCHAMRGQAPENNPSLLVWRDPWDPTGWEVTEEFIMSWGWVIAGCTDLLRSTNSWRARRGERPLFR